MAAAGKDGPDNDPDGGKAGDSSSPAASSTLTIQSP